MGLLGGLLGIGGSAVMIPAMTLAFGENQHLYQAAAMICNFFVASSSMVAHYRAQSFVWPTLRWMVPAAVVGIIGGVILSNSSMFAGERSYILARIFGGFLVYVVIINGMKFFKSFKRGVRQEEKNETINAKHHKHPNWLSALIGAITGVAAGLLGIGAGTVATPLQQLVLKTPLKNSISNSAATIVCISWIGALIKNCTLVEHGIEWVDSVKIAVFVIPTAVLG